MKSKQERQRDLLDHQMDRLERKLNRLVWLVYGLLAQGERLMKELDDLETQVAANTSAEESAVVLLQGLAAQILALKDDPVKLAALANSLKTSGDKLAAAVVENTPQA